MKPPETVVRLDRTAVLVVSLLWALQPACLSAQDTSGEGPDSVTVVPGPRYAKSGFLKFFAGSGYRDLWRVPIRAPVADLSTLAGGLTPLRLGGGMTTRTLHVTGNDGLRYVFRSVDKYPGQGLDEELRGTLFEAVLQDQISAFHPSAALVVPGLLEAVDVLHVEPVLYVLPDDERLGEFRELMADELVTFEERPEGAAAGMTGFQGSSRVVNTEDFLAELESDPGNRLDATGYLTARLIDLLIGDRDRSVNNWSWAGFDSAGGRLWRPVPRDRDQAFVQLDGAAKAVIRFYEPRMVRFSTEVPDVRGLTRNAWDIDRPLLSVIEKAEWDSVVASVQRRITDAVIRDAVRRMPPEHVALEGELMARQLEARRDRLREIADDFYRLVSEYADMHTTDVAENVLVEWLPDGRATITVVPIASGGSDANAALEGDPVLPRPGPAPQVPRAWLRRTFDPDETREIRLYLHGGDDRVLVRGAGQRPITLRLIGGGGADMLTDSSSGGGRAFFYDGGGRTVVGGSGTKHVARDIPRPRSWGETAAESPDWGSVWVPRPALPYSTDLGILIYAGAGRTTYGFGRQPYASTLRFGAGFAPRESKFVANVSYEVREALGRAHASFTLDYSGIETLNFFGFGNETELAESPGFYELRRGRLLARPMVSIPFGSAAGLDFGIRFELSDTDTLPEEPNLVSTTRPYGTGRILQGGAEVALRVDTRDRPLAATRGVFVQGAFRTYPALLDVDRPFSRFQGEASTFLSTTASGAQTLALRVGGEKTWGTLPFYEAAFLGGPARLRGFRQERFAGDASLFGSAELHVALGQAAFLLPWHVGAFGFGDAGRVFVSGESGGGWHTSFGGGISFAPIDPRFTGSITVARSPEGTTFYVGSGIGF